MDTKVKKVPVRIINEHGHMHDGVQSEKGEIINVTPEVLALMKSLEQPWGEEVVVQSAAAPAAASAAAE